jgi:hypothetical protein
MERERDLRVDDRFDGGISPMKTFPMKIFPMKIFACVIAAASCLAASPLAVSPAAAEYLFYRNSSVLDAHREFGVPFNRLDRDDLARERAREAEHQRIRTRLGDPGRACQAMAVEGRVPSPDLLVVICR